MKVHKRKISMLCFLHVTIFDRLMSTEKSILDFLFKDLAI